MTHGLETLEKLNREACVKYAWASLPPLSLYIYFFKEDGVIESSQFPPTDADRIAVLEDIIDIVKFTPGQEPLRYEPYKDSKDVWHKITSCEYINVCGSICHMPAGTEPYSDEEE